MIKAASLAFALAFAAPASAEDFQVPAFTGEVVDQGSMLSPSTRESLTMALRQFHGGGGSQIVVLTVPDLGGIAVEQASIKVFDQWKPGSTKGDNGILLLVAKAERRARIEVGQGLEGSLPDAYARRIIDDVLVPQFKQGNYDQGIVQAVWAIAARTDPDRKLGVDTPPPRDEPRDANPKFTFIIFLIIFGVMLLPRLFGVRPSARSRQTGFWGGGGGWGGGGWGGGGGGGFSGGGGGSSSGGGASGSW